MFESRLPKMKIGNHHRDYVLGILRHEVGHYITANFFGFGVTSIGIVT